ncbi:MAG TPA: LON peptidase substrate-binding domain-containing protein, partial [Arenicellales bacterium]|nr:LON peptidase substrate-binding domain-containing protein [Arenicellales bacterium]
MNESENAATEFIPKEEGDRPQGDLVRPEHILPDTLHLIPLTSRPYFPVMVQPVIVDEKPWATSIEAVVDSAHRAVALNYSKAADGGIPRPNEIRPVGCVARIHKVHHADGKFQFIAQGMHRFEIIQWITREVPYVVRVEYLKTPVTDDEDQLRAYAQAVINIIKQLMTLNPLYNEELKQHLNRFNPNDASPLADFAAAITSADAEELQDILETIPLIQRMEKVLPILGKELEVAKLQAQIT